MALNKIEKFTGTGFYSGFYKKAPGTAGSLVALIIYLIPGMENPTILIGLISFFSALNIIIAPSFIKEYGNDPKQFTIDEFVGTWISLFLLPKKIWFILPAFIIWRIIDIFKPFPIRHIEKLKGAWGILLDDVFAGLVTNIIFQLIIFLIAGIL